MNILYLIPLLTLSTHAIGATMEESCDQVIDKGYYKICYSFKYKAAKFVWYTLDGKKVNLNNIKGRPRFYSEKTIPAKFRASYSDYTRNKFSADRGHLAPDASFDWAEEPLHAVYSMANIIPQYKWVNRKTWVKAEKYERYAAKKYGVAEIVNGVVFSKASMNGISYPKKYWKMVKTHRFKKCFLYENSNTVDWKNDELKDHYINCSELPIPDWILKDAK